MLGWFRRKRKTAATAQAVPVTAKPAMAATPMPASAKMPPPAPASVPPPAPASVVPPAPSSVVPHLVASAPVALQASAAATHAEAAAISVPQAVRALPQEPPPAAAPIVAMPVAGPARMAAIAATPTVSAAAAASPTAPARPGNSHTIAHSLAALRQLTGQKDTAAAPRAGMAAMRVMGVSAKRMTIVGVQADGRRVLAKAADLGTGHGHVYAFTRRADASYRLEGATGRGARLVIGTPLAGH